MKYVIEHFQKESQGEIELAAADQARALAGKTF